MNTISYSRKLITRGLSNVKNYLRSVNFSSNETVERSGRSHGLACLICAPTRAFGTSYGAGTFRHGPPPTYGKERAYTEMLESSELTEEQARIITNNLAANGGALFGLPRGVCIITGSWIMARLTRGSYMTGRESSCFFTILCAQGAHLFARNLDCRGRR